MSASVPFREKNRVAWAVTGLAYALSERFWVVDAGNRGDDVLRRDPVDGRLAAAEHARVAAGQVRALRRAEPHLDERSWDAGSWTPLRRAQTLAGQLAAWIPDVSTRSGALAYPDCAKARRPPHPGCRSRLERGQPARRCFEMQRVVRGALRGDALAEGGSTRTALPRVAT